LDEMNKEANPKEDDTACVRTQSHW
jgi:hypothetical protein